MFVEVFVFRRDERIGDEFRHRLDRQIQPPLARVFRDQRAVGRMHAGHHRRFVVLELRVVRQVLRVVPQQARGRTNAHEENRRAGCEQKAQKAKQQFHESTSSGHTDKRTQTPAGTVILVGEIGRVLLCLNLGRTVVSK